MSWPSRPAPARTTPRMTALRPGQSPPPVRTPMRAIGGIVAGSAGGQRDHALPRSERERTPDRLAVAAAVGADRDRAEDAVDPRRLPREVECDDDPVAPAERPGARRRVQLRIGARAQVRLPPAQRDEVAAEVQGRPRVLALVGDV